MRIGVLGPPGVEKSKFARALGKEFGLKVVDNYVQRLQKASELALGPWSSYAEHFMVAGLRLAEEAKVGDERITVGTSIDTLTYAMVKSDVVMHQSSEAARAVYLSAQAAVQGLTLMYTETWEYHLSFLLPYNDEQREELGRGWETTLDDAYAPVIESYGVPFTYTLHGTTAERIKVATEIINLAKEETAENAPKATPTDE